MHIHSLIERLKELQRLEPNAQVLILNDSEYLNVVECNIDDEELVTIETE